MSDLLNRLCSLKFRFHEQNPYQYDFGLFIRQFILTTVSIIKIQSKNQQTLSTELFDHHQMINLKIIKQLARDDIKLFSILKAHRFLFSFARSSSSHLQKDSSGIKLNQLKKNGSQYSINQRIKDSRQIKDKQSAEGLSAVINNPELVRCLEQRQILSLFPVQEKTYKAIYEGKDLIVSDRTGSGKTIAYSLPVLDRILSQNKKSQRRGRNTQTMFLVMVPTRQLAKQVQKQIISLLPRRTEQGVKKLEVTALYGGSSISQQINQLERGSDIIVATPGRLLDMIKNNRVNFQGLRTLCLDEADEMLARGFQEDIEQIILHINKSLKSQTAKVSKRGKSDDPLYQTLLFSATIPSWVLRISQDYMKSDKQIFNLIENQEDGQNNSRTSTTVEHLAIQARNYKSQQQTIAVLNALIQQYANKGQGRAIIFVQTKKQASELSYQMENSVALHGDISQKQRMQNLDSFSSDKGTIFGKKTAKILIATDVAARGLDIPNVQLVIQTQPPQYSQSYIHRSGRTGRMGKHGKSITLFNKSNFRDLLEIQKHARIEIREICLPNNNVEKENLIQEVISEIKRMNPNKFSREKEIIVNSIKNQLIVSSQNDSIKLEHSLQKVLSYFLFENSRDLGKNLLAQLSTKSLLNPLDQHAVTFILRPSANVQNLDKKQVIQQLKTALPPFLTQKILKTIKKNGNDDKTYVFDVESQNLSDFTEALATNQNLRNSYVIRKAKGSEVQLPFISDHPYSNSSFDHSYRRGFQQRNHSRNDNQKVFKSSGSWGRQNNENGQGHGSRRYNNNEGSERNGRGNRGYGQNQQTDRKRKYFDF